MNLFTQITVNTKQLFHSLYFAPTEKALDEFIDIHPEIFRKPDNWLPLGETKNNFAIIKNQQANPIAALIEKITNSIDAILMKRTYEIGIDPRSSDAPQTMDEAIVRFFPDYKNWDLKSFRRNQSEDIQVVADGTPRDTSVIIYDNGEGQHPEDFENTFLSLI
ncbi:unnamed protein product, partial [marine sediment metagenome]